MSAGSLRRDVRRVWLWWKSRGQRCDHCGRRKHLNDAWFGNGGTARWHAECSSLLRWKAIAEDRLAVVDLVTDLTGLSERDVTSAAELRAPSAVGYRTPEEAEAWDQAWRVMRDVRVKRSELRGDE